MAPLQMSKFAQTFYDLKREEAALERDIAELDKLKASVPDRHTHETTGTTNRHLRENSELDARHEQEVSSLATTHEQEIARLNARTNDLDARFEAYFVSPTYILTYLHAIS